MEKRERNDPGPEDMERPTRRVGTFTVGLTLVSTGVVMLISLIFPRLDFTWVLKLSPLMLICLGVETLLTARGSGWIKYDWVGMLLCCLIVSVALGLFTAAWCLAQGLACWY